MACLGARGPLDPALSAGAVDSCKSSEIFWGAVPCGCGFTFFIDAPVPFQSSRWTSNFYLKMIA